MLIWNSLKENQSEEVFCQRITLSFAAVYKDFVEFTNELFVK